MPGDALRTGDQLDEAILSTVGHGTVHLAHRQLTDPSTSSARFGLSDTYPGHLGTREGDPRRVVGAVAASIALLERIAGSDASHLIGRMGERQLSGHVANGVHARNGGAKPVVRLNVAIGVERRSEFVETKPLGIRGAAGCEQYLVDLDGAAGQAEFDPAGRPTDRFDSGPRDHRDAACRERGLDNRRRLGFLLR